MRWIEKSGTSPDDFDRWDRVGGWNASHCGHHTHNQKAERLKHVIKDILLREQHYICCYCEDRISEDRSHIEHVAPRSKPEFSHLISDYHNLLCSCNIKQSCGDAKKNAVINITPLSQACETSFSYSDNGEIQGIGQDADAVVQLLRLNSERLKAARKGVIDNFLWEMPAMTVAEFDGWIGDYLSPDSQGHLPRFWSATNQTAQKYRATFE